ncbi:AfsR family transcriptional regulator [Streptomyces sp. AS58]|uniref:BTAD domain-containing putative transcriptional regulator n=1 Tax=Streptomyces sp. AS58 TaxID=1519489 RepID=UPI0006AFD28F|nr:BTAD domain-containing putative transcriptional regulator [Streptomyces sp. AS58]KOV58984.1 AfsR family transcriptional regulator [Streptomyces sp. AS58]
MRFQLLGLLSISDGDHAVVLQPSKPTSLLAALLIHPGAVVSTDYLLRAVWDTEPPATARAALQSCVLRLRRIFAKYGIANDTIEAVPGGYRMRMDRETLDLVRFRDLVRSAGSTRDQDTERYALREALDLWHGPVLANVSSRMLHRDEAPRLTEERLSALERLCDIELARGRCREVLAEVWDAARRHPERERFAEQLIEALYRTGRQTEALAEIRAVKERLKEEFGIDPGAPLQRLELAILRGEELDGSPARAVAAIEARVSSDGARLAAARNGATATVPALVPALPASPAQVPALAAAPSPAHALPARTTEQSAATVPVPTVAPVPCFTGRGHQLVALQRALTSGGPEAGPVVISGAPGIGKTALALQAAHLVQEAFPGGCFTVPLTGPDGEPLGADEARAQLPPPGPAGRRLLILDDAVSAEQVRPLLPAPAEGVAVVTSRRGLAGLVATHGGVVLRLDTFDEEESHRLLVGTLGAERVAAEPDATRRLARICGHFPLGLRIAAARLQTRPGLGIGDCAGWLAADLPARLSLADEPLMSVPRVFEAALRRLSPDLSEAFLLLATEQADAAVSGTSPGVPDEVLEQLADAGLIEEGPPKPYRIHELLRIYARQQTAAPPRPSVRTASATG